MTAQELTAQKREKERRMLLLAELAGAERLRREREQSIICVKTQGKAA